MTGSATNISQSMLVQTKVTMQPDAALTSPPAKDTRDFLEFFSRSMDLPTFDAMTPKAAPPVKVDNNPSAKFARETAKPGTDSAPRSQEVSAKVEEFAKDVKEVIAKELDCDVEDVEEAMEVLGLSAVDLLDVKNIAMLVLSLTDQENYFSLLTSESFSDIVDEVTALADNLSDNLKMQINQIVDLMKPILAEDADEDLMTDVAFDEVLNNSAEVTEDATVTQEVAEKDGETVSADEAGREVPVALKERNPRGISDKEDTRASKDILTEDTKPVETENSPKANTNANDRNSRNSREMGNDRNLNNVAMDVDSKPAMVFEPKAATITLSDGQTVNVSSIIDQIVEQTKITASSEVTKLEMFLNPEGLGKVYMELSQKGNEVTAKIFTENEVVKEALENQMATLRESMNSSSTKITSIEVSVGTHEFERNLEENEHQRHQQEEQTRGNAPAPKRMSIDLNDLDSLSGLMTEEEQLVARIMRDNGNTVNYSV